MKKLLLSIVLLSFIINSFCQDKKSVPLSKDFFLQKSKRQNTAAWILLGGGTAMMLAGAVAFNHNYDYGSSTATDISGFVLLGGLVADVISIPLFIGAHKNKKLAARVAINDQKIPSFKNNSTDFVMQPTVRITIGL